MTAKQRDAALIALGGVTFAHRAISNLEFTHIDDDIDGLMSEAETVLGKLRKMIALKAGV